MFCSQQDDERQKLEAAPGNSEALLPTTDNLMGSVRDTSLSGVYVFVCMAVLEIVVGHQTFSDQNWCLSEHVPAWSDIMSYHNMLTGG